ncbi:MAG: DUF6159 family protein [Planctomycetota bacterium]
MFERIATGWALTKQAFNVLRLDKELLLFPILSGACCLLVIASFFVPAYAFGWLDSGAGDRASPTSRIFLAMIGFAFYFVNYFIMVFFNSALVGCSVIRLKGGDPTVSDGFATALSRLPQIAAWSAVAATVGVILKSFENKNNKAGQFVIGLIGAAWSMLTFFVVPIIVIEQLGPIAAIKRSTSLLSETWGEYLDLQLEFVHISRLDSGSPANHGWRLSDCQSDDDDWDPDPPPGDIDPAGNIAVNQRLEFNRAGGTLPLRRGRPDGRPFRSRAD